MQFLPRFDFVEGERRLFFSFLFFSFLFFSFLFFFFFFLFVLFSCLSKSLQISTIIAVLSYSYVLGMLQHGRNSGVEMGGREARGRTFDILFPKTKVSTQNKRQRSSWKGLLYAFGHCQPGLVFCPFFKLFLFACYEKSAARRLMRLFLFPFLFIFLERLSARESERMKCLSSPKLKQNKKKR